MTLWEILKANKLGYADDMFTMLAANKMNGGRDRLHELSGTPPLSFTAKGKPLTAWGITGNTVQTGTPTPDNPVEVQAVGDRTANVFPAGEKKTVVSNGITFDSDGSGRYHISGTASARSSVSFNLVSGFTAPISVSNGGQGTLSFFNTQPNSSVDFAFYNGTTKVDDWTMGSINRTSVAYNAMGNKYVDKVIIIINSGATVDITIMPEFTNDGVLPSGFEPYGYKIPVVTRGKNLLEPIGFSAEIITNINDYREKTNNYGTSLSTVYGGSVLVTQANQINTTTSYINGVFFIAVDFSKFTTGKNYILSFDYEIKEKHSGQGNSIAYIGNSTSPTKIYGDWGKDGRKSATFTVKEGFKPYIAIILCGNSIFVSNIQIEEDLTATPYEPYHEPITTPIYLPTPLYSGEVMRSDGTITRSDGTTETFTAPQIPTINGTTVIDVDTAVKPESMTIKYRR